MGHVRLGRLPHRLKWSAVVALLGETPTDGAVVAKATIEAAEQHLISLRDDPALNYCFWLLTRITWAARSDGFLSELNALGFSLGVDTPTLAFVAAVTEACANAGDAEPGVRRNGRDGLTGFTASVDRDGWATGAQPVWNHPERPPGGLSHIQHT